MSVDNTASAMPLEENGSGMDLAGIRALRLALATTLSVAIAYGVGWPLSFITTIFTWNFLKAPTMLPLRAGLMIVNQMAVGCALGIVLTLTVLQYPGAFISAVFLIMFLIYYANACGKSPFLIICLTIGTTVVPMMGLQARGLAVFVSVYLVLGIAVAVLFTWLAQGLLPDRLAPVDARAATTPQKPPAPALPREEQIYKAWTSTLVVSPVIAIFYLLNLSDKIVVMVSIALVAQQASLDAGSKAALGMLIGNILGGIAAVIFYYALLAAPTYSFLIVLILATALIFARGNFSGTPRAPVYGAVYSTLLLLTGLGISATGDAVPAKMFSRIGQIILVVIYIIAAFSLVERFRKRKHSKR